MIGLILYVVLSPAIWLLAIPLLLLTRKGRLRVRETRPLYRAALRKLRERRDARPVLLFHAASAGEFEQLKPLLRRLDRNAYFVFQTFFSPTICVRERGSDLFDACCYHPLDSFVSAFVFFLRVRPSVYVLNRHDLWPAHIAAARLLGIRTAVINANLHDRSLRLLPLLRSFNRAMFGMVDLVTCGSARLERNIRSLAPGARIEVVGETRFEQVVGRAAANRRDHFDGPVMDRRNIILGSIIPSDHDVVFGGIRAWWGDSDGVSTGRRIIAVPHDVAEGDVARLESVMDRYGFSHHRHSRDQAAGDGDAVIVDRVGILADLYAYGYAAYVGAGFGAGTHSVIEPAAYGIPVFFGPNIHILDEAVAMKERGIGTVVGSAGEVAAFLRSLDDPERYRSLCAATEAFIKETGCASARICELLAGLCAGARPQDGRDGV